MKGYSFGELVKLAEAALPKTDNAVSATKLQTARTIGGVAFDGTGNINLPGVNIAGTQNTSGRAAVASTADKLTTARNINGVAFDGTKNIDISAGAVGTYTKSEIDSKDNLKLNLTGGTVTGKLTAAQLYTTNHTLETGHSGSWDYVPPQGITRMQGPGGPHETTVYTGLSIGWQGSQDYGATIAFRNNSFMFRTLENKNWGSWNRLYHTGNKPTAVDVGALASNGTAVAATKLATARTISGVAFDGTANISITAANVGALPSGGTAVAATKLATPRAINGVNFDGSANITITAAANGGTSAACSGNAATATKLATARTIAGVAFDGSANISISASNVGALATTGGTVTGAILLNHLTNQLRGTRSDVDVNTRASDTEMGWGYTGTSTFTSTPNLFPAANNANGILSFNTHSGGHYHQIGLSSNGNLYHRSNLSPAWAALYTARNKPTAADVGALASNGTAVAATKLATPRAINGVNFDGSAAITITAAANGGTSAACSGNAATATKLATARAINGVNFDGTAAITITDSTKVPTTRKVNNKALSGDISLTASDVGALPLSGGTLTGLLKSSVTGNTYETIGGFIRASRNDCMSVDGKSYGFVTSTRDVHLCYNSYWDGTWKKYDNSASSGYVVVNSSGLGYMQSPGGNSNPIANNYRIYHQGFKPTAADVGALPSGGTAAAATKLATARTINGTAFDGTGNITITAAANGGTSAACSGNAATATTLQTARTIGGVSFNGSANIVPTDINPATSTSTGMFNLAWFSGTRIYHTNSKMQVRPSDGYLTAGSISTGSGTITCGNLNASGVVSSNSFRGDGSSLTNLSMSQLGVSLVTLFSASGGQTSGNFTLSEPYSNYKQLLIISSPDDNAYRISKNMWSSEIDVLQATGVRYHLIDDLNNHWSGRFNEDKRTFVTANQNSRIHAVYGYR